MNHDSFEDDPTFLPADAAQTVRYYTISALDGTLLGALYLGDRNGFMAFIPVDGPAGDLAAEEWNERAMVAIRAVGHGRDAFPYWYEHAGQTYLVGSIRQAASVDDLQRLVRGGA